ncbi:hypothetical protein BHE74_00059572 [Ensete ventricosum]|nr:hypothetical protein BHE74_00059572 [Ensete ventricosum]RZR93909.1 hypothetical protein BHM03_00022495 [Ensete ventricosum]
MKKAVVARAPHPEEPCPATKPIVEKALATEVEPHLKRLKKGGDSVIPAKEASPAPAPRPRSGPERARGEGCNRKKEKTIACPNP